MARAKITMAIEVIPPEGLRSPSIPRPVESPLQLFEIFAYPASFPLYGCLLTEAMEDKDVKYCFCRAGHFILRKLWFIMHILNYVILKLTEHDDETVMYMPTCLDVNMMHHDAELHEGSRRNYMVAFPVSFFFRFKAILHISKTWWKVYCKDGKLF
ncbi:uncharacterized protein LOC103714940 isoform X1 [Phoenix dactylifera]|uniref:Uncharacterized protein LOC103714940 isoform X1 n=1 Tax=Phoenix dactylifera TaxID=42345 RepID=A0A8B7CJM3_PHODC|nr:uncharacterized protein LOC103714940 isoform X1 [Phoenix dactylifera]